MNALGTLSAIMYLIGSGFVCIMGVMFLRSELNIRTDTLGYIATMVGIVGIIDTTVHLHNTITTTPRAIYLISAVIALIIGLIGVVLCPRLLRK